MAEFQQFSDDYIEVIKVVVTRAQQGSFDISFANLEPDHVMKHIDLLSADRTAYDRLLLRGGKDLRQLEHPQKSFKVQASFRAMNTLDFSLKFKKFVGGIHVVVFYD